MYGHDDTSTRALNKKSEDSRMGTRMVTAGLITPEQRDYIAETLWIRKNKGDDIRFGELAVEEGYCTKEEVEAMPGYIGDQLVNVAGLLTPEQQLGLITKQREFRAKGINIRYGELVVQEGYCTREELERLIRLFNMENTTTPKDIPIATEDGF